MSTVTQKVTAEQFLRMPDNHMRRELIAGEVQEMSPAGVDHGGIAMQIILPLGHFVKEKGLGAIFSTETGFILSRDPDTVRVPDITFVRGERLAIRPKKSGFFLGAPDLAIEVISPTDRLTKVKSKAKELLRAGCRMVVVVNPRKRTLAVYSGTTDVTNLTIEATFDGGDVVPGFRLPVRDIFAD